LAPYSPAANLLVFGVVMALAAAVVVITACRSRRRRFWQWSRSRPGRFWEWLGFGKTGKKAGLDLFQFFVALSIPFAVVGIGAYFTSSQAQDTALQSYLDGMAKLVIDNDLANSEEGDEVRTLAQAQTLTVLASLDPQHKRSVVEFLSSSNLIDAKTSVITLTNADLSDANLRFVDLSNANLKDANLTDANLIYAHLSEADLSDAFLMYADLKGADLEGANLKDAKLTDANLAGAYLVDADLERAWVTDEQLDAAYSLEGATMPDGSKHD